MQLLLTILAGFGALIFLICFLAYVISGFRHHFVTGLISMLPVLNVVTLPSLWDKSSGKFLLGFIGLFMTTSAWFLGADTGFKNLTSNDTNEEIVVMSQNKNLTIPNQTETNYIESIQAKRHTVFNENNMIKLPNKALYIMGFDEVPVNQISTLHGRIVEITKTDNQIVQGRIKNLSNSTVLLDGLVLNELPLASIKQLKLMVKKAN